MIILCEILDEIFEIWNLNFNFPRNRHSQGPYVILLEIFGESVNFAFYENILFICFKNQCLHFFQSIYKVAVVRFK